MTVGEAVRLIRTARNESQGQAAVALKTTQPTVSKVESGRVNPHPAFLARVRAAYGFCPLAVAVLSDDSLDLDAHRALIGPRVGVTAPGSRPAG